MKKLLVFFGVVFLFSSRALPYVVIGYEGDPFYYKNGAAGISGPCHDIIQEMCRKEGISCKFKIGNLQTVLSMLDKGSADIACPLVGTPERNKFLHFSGPIFDTGYTLFGTPEAAEKVLRAKDLKGYSVSAYAPSFTYDSLVKYNKKIGNKMKVFDESGELTSLLKAEKVNKSLAYINRDIGLRWIKKTRSPLKEINVARHPVVYRIAFSKKTIAPARYDKFMIQINKMRDNGYFKDLEKQYGVKFSVPETKKAED